MVDWGEGNPKYDCQVLVNSIIAAVTLNMEFKRCN